MSGTPVSGGCTTSDSGALPTSVMSGCARHHDVDPVLETLLQPAGEHRGPRRVVVPQRARGVADVEGLRLPDGRQPDAVEVADRDLDARPVAAHGRLDLAAHPAELARRLRGAVARDVPHDAVVPVHRGEPDARVVGQARDREEDGVGVLLDELAEGRQRARVVPRVERRHQLVAHHEPLGAPGDQRCAEDPRRDGDGHQGAGRDHASSTQEPGTPGRPRQQHDHQHDSRDDGRDGGPAGAEDDHGDRHGHRDQRRRRRHSTGARPQGHRDGERRPDQRQDVHRDQEGAVRPDRRLEGQHLLPGRRGAPRQVERGLRRRHHPADRRAGCGERAAGQHEHDDQHRDDRDRGPPARSTDPRHRGAQQQSADQRGQRGPTAVDRQQGHERQGQGADEAHDVDDRAADRSRRHEVTRRSRRGRSSR